MSDLTPEQRERFVCCLKPRLCRDEHFHDRNVAQMLADERERIAREIEALPEYDGAGWPNRAYEIKEDAARIARGDA